ncbi:hypothetical protein [Aliarcobacter skirrowii]|uniref:hypothetical protein n=1 Tax=Aliarcobacter skirrowii TaxID=28200 RepID=UPI0029BBF253|nr:hypothetical protein [Aliarcobacter skirrowii]MDX4036525.1 hypothetical protein [Aliarcobacter skirrowii]
MITNYQQTTIQIIFVNMNITIINLSKDKIDELNKCFKILDKSLVHNLINDKKEIGKSVVEIISLMEMIFEDSISTKLDIEKYNNPYKQAIESGLFFLNYINEKILSKDLIDVEIYNSFNKFIINHIEQIIHNKEQFFFELYIYKWLKKEGYVHSYSINCDNIEDEKLTNFYNKYHRKILDWVIYNRDNLNQNPLDNNKNKVYYDLLNSYDKISLQNIEEK